MTDPMWGLSGIYALVILGVVVVIVTALSRVQVGHGLSLRAVFRQTHFLELTTVIVIIVSGTFLAWSGKLSDGVVALLSGVAGYVRGGVRTPKSDPEAAQSQQTTKA